MKTVLKIILLVGILLAVLVVFNQESPQKKEARYLRRGNALFDAGAYAKARLEYKNAAKIKPAANPEITYRLGLVDEAEGDIHNAFLNFLQAEQQNPHFHAALLKIAHYQLVADNIEETQKRVDTVLAEAPDNPEAHALQGALFLRKRNFSGTEKEARLALGKEPANITAISVLTGLYMANGELAKAAEIVDEGIARNPKDISLPMLKVRLYETPLNLQKTKEAYQTIFMLRPHDSQFRIYLANTYLDANKPDEAEATLREGIAVIPDDWYMKQQLVMFLSKNRTMDTAEKEIRKYMQAYPENADLYFWLASLYLAHNQVDKAVALFEQIISKSQTNKRSLNAQASLAHINFIKGNKELAEKMVDAVLNKAPINREALFIRASIAVDDGAYQKAVSDLRIIIRDQPQDKDALKLLAEVLLLQGYTDLAIDTLNQLVDIDPSNSAVLVRLAQMYNLNGDPQRALELLAIVTKNDPHYPIGWESTARIAIGIKDFETATVAIHHLDALDGQHMTAAFLEGQMAQSYGKNEDARSSYIKVIDADPVSPQAALALYALVAAQQTPQELEATTQYIVHLKTDNAYVMTILGECYLQLGKVDLAAASFDKAIANHPTSQDPFIYRAKIYLHRKQTDAAIAILKQAAAAVPTDIRAALLEVDTLHNFGQYKEAIGIYEKILKNNPAMDEVANNMAVLIADHEYADPAMLEKAHEAAERFINASNPLLLDTLGWVYYRQGNLDEAQKVLAKAVAFRDKATPEIHYHYGIILLKMGKIPEAKVEFAQAITERANYSALEEAKKIMKEIN